MIKIFFLFLPIFLFAVNENATPGKYVDFGKEGKLYDITEPDFDEILKEALLDYQKNNELNIKENVVKAVDKASVFESDLPLCQKDTERDWEQDYYVLQTDLYNPMGRRYKKAGEVMKAPPMPPGIKTSFCFIDGKNIIAAKNQINFFKRTIGDCLYLVNNIDVRKVKKSFPSEKVFPNQNATKERFGIRCLPASVSFENDLRKVKYYSYEYFKTSN